MTKQELIDTLAGMIDDGRCSEAGATEREVEELLKQYVRNYSITAAGLLIQRGWISQLTVSTPVLVANDIEEAFVTHFEGIDLTENSSFYDGTG